MSLKQIIYDILKDSNLSGLLAKSPIDGSLALYEIFAPQGSQLPYISYSMDESNSDTHFARNNGTINFEIYSQDSTEELENIKTKLIEILDKRRFSIGTGNHIYFAYVTDDFIFTDFEDVLHHHIEFNFFYWRAEFIEQLDI